MTIQPEPETWLRAVQIELDGLKRSTDSKISLLADRINSFVSEPVYNADKRNVDLQMTNVKDKIDDVESDALVLKSDVIKLIDEFKRDNAVAHTRLEKAIQDEATARQTQQKEEAAARQSNFRWMISAVLIPIVLAIMDLILNKK